MMLMNAIFYWLLFSLVENIFAQIIDTRPPLKIKCQSTAQNVTYDGKKSFVCVCDENFCDDLLPIGDVPKNTAIIITSSASSKRFVRQTIKFSDFGDTSADVVQIKLTPSISYQRIMGFGCAFTDAFGIVHNNLSESMQNKLIASYWSDKGLRYIIGRIPIASCDFSTHPYSYDDVVGDLNLTYFALANEDLKYKIPVVKKAQRMAQTFGNRLNLFSSPWSPPGWMKTSGKMKGGAPLYGKPGEPYYKTWANYFVKFFDAYKMNNITFWGLTVENEPSAGVWTNYPFQALNMNQRNERDFIKMDLGPALHKNGYENLKLMINDDNRLMIPSYARTVLDDPVANKYVSGIGVHWYMDDFFPASMLSNVRDRYPDKFILATEACNGFASSTLGIKSGPVLGSWLNAERYANDIIDNINNWSIGWVDWNCALDTMGGPNWVQNYVDSPVIVNASANEFYKQPMFYAMGHFSAFILPGSRRIKHTLENTQNAYLKVTTLTTPKRQRVIVILNRMKEIQRISIISDMKQRVLNLRLDPLSINTVIFNKE